MSVARKLTHGSFGRFLLAEMDVGLTMHAHPHYHVLCKGRGPDVRFLANGELHTLTSENIIVMKAWEPHALLVDTSSSTQVLAINLEPNWVWSTFERCSASGGFDDLPVRSLSLSPELRTFVRDVVAELERGSRSADIPAGDLLGRLLKDIIYRAPDRGVQPHSATHSRITDFRVRRAVAMFHQLSPSTFDLEAVARECGLSRAHFFHQFRQQLGVSPAVYVNALRIEAAIKGLVAGNESIKHLGTNIGFRAQGNFTRFFRERVGITPRDYRVRADIND